MEKSTVLKHKITTTDKEGNHLVIDISLDDDCKNGHQDFSITCNAWQKGKPHSDRYHLYGGCAHDEIMAARPDLRPFVDLHMADLNGAPMYAVENGMFHIKEGKHDYAKSHLRVTDEEYGQLRKCDDKLYFTYMLIKLGIPNRWAEEAKTAIKLLEEWTGKEFENVSTRSQFTPISEEVMANVDGLIQAGYYTDAAIENRHQKAVSEALQKEYDRIKKQRDDDVHKANRDYAIKKAVLDAGIPLDNFIYYAHTNKGVFNWQDTSYRKKVTQDEFDGFMSKVSTAGLPEGITFEIKVA